MPLVETLPAAPRMGEAARRPSGFKGRLVNLVCSPATFWVALVALCVARAYVGLYGVRTFAPDGFIVLDGAWRMLHGQRPHVDFNSMVGAVAYLPTLLGLLLSHETANGFGYGQALVAFALGAWAYALGNGLSAPARACFALCTAIVAVSPAAVGPTPLDIGPGMTYNRLGYALLSLMLLDTLQDRGASQEFRGLSSGVVLGLLAFLKITMLFAGVLVLVGFALLSPRTRRGWLALVGSASVVIFGFLAYLHFRIYMIFKDLAITVGAKHIQLTKIYSYNSIFFEAAVAIALTLGLSAWVAGKGNPATASRIRRAGFLVVALSCLLIFGNFQHSELPLVTFFAIVTLDQTFATTQRTAADPVRTTLLSVGGCFVAVMVLSVMVALLVGIRARLYTVRYARHLATPALDPFVPVALDYFYVDFVNDGLKLLAAHRRPGEHVMSLDFSNAFSFGLHIPPAPGGTTNLQFHGSFDTTHKVPAARLFGASELVMVPVPSLDVDLQRSIEEIYGGYLQAHYHLVGSSAEWMLYRRDRPVSQEFRAGLRTAQ